VPAADPADAPRIEVGEREMPQATSQWTCPRCGSSWVNVVTFEPVKDRAQETKAALDRLPEVWGVAGAHGEAGRGDHGRSHDSEDAVTAWGKCGASGAVRR